MDSGKVDKKSWKVKCLRETFVPLGALLLGPEIKTDEEVVNSEYVHQLETERDELKGKLDKAMDELYTISCATVFNGEWIQKENASSAKRTYNELWESLAKEALKEISSNTGQNTALVSGQLSSHDKEISK